MNRFGNFFHITTFGESHGAGLGVVVDGFPPGHCVDLARIQRALARRRPGQSEFSSPRQEPDEVELLSGVEGRISLGSPLAFLVRNRDANAGDYVERADIFRPSHADYTTQLKYGVRSKRGGGRASARETLARVIGGALAEQLLETVYPQLRCVAFVDSLGPVEASGLDGRVWTQQQVDESPLRCPDAEVEKKMVAFLRNQVVKGDTVGGRVRCHIYSPPKGLGDPIFEKLTAELAHAMMTLPASRAFEVGEGVFSGELLGSQHNDSMYGKDQKVRFHTNHAGGLQGGISTGETIKFSVTFKAVSSIRQSQTVATEDGGTREFNPQKGRHDPTVLPRVVPLVEAMALLVMVERVMRQSLVRSFAGPCSDFSLMDV